MSGSVSLSLILSLSLSHTHTISPPFESAKTLSKQKWLQRIGHKRHCGFQFTLFFSWVICSGGGKLSWREDILAALLRGPCAEETEVSCQQSHECAILQMEPQALVKPWDDCSSGWQLYCIQPHLRPWATTTQPSHSQIPDTQKLCEIINCLLF